MGVRGRRQGTVLCLLSGLKRDREPSPVSSLNLAGRPRLPFHAALHISGAEGHVDIPQFHLAADVGIIHVRHSGRAAITGTAQISKGFFYDFAALFFSGIFDQITHCFLFSGVPVLIGIMM